MATIIKKPASGIIYSRDLTATNTTTTKLRQLQEMATEVLAGDENKRLFFYGNDDAAKWITAYNGGKAIGKKVYRVHFPSLLSKYIGETEKNIDAILKKSENKQWILFFDEADALFGKRTEVKDAHDKYANQEVSYLLQRLEEYNGVIIFSLRKSLRQPKESTINAKAISFT